jgi:hypothetical protein
MARDLCPALPTFQPIFSTPTDRFIVVLRKRDARTMRVSPRSVPVVCFGELSVEFVRQGSERCYRGRKPFGI